MVTPETNSRPSNPRTAVGLTYAARSLLSMRTFHLILYIVAAVLFAIAAFAPTALPKVNLLAAGLLVWIIVPLSVVIDEVAD